MTLGEVGRRALRAAGSPPWARLGVTQALAGLQAWSEAGLFTAPARPGFLSGEAWLPGFWGRTGVGFLLPKPQVTHNLKV